MDEQRLELRPEDKAAVRQLVAGIAEPVPDGR